MKIILDIESVRYPLTGIGRYTLTLARELVKPSRGHHVQLLASPFDKPIETPDELEHYVNKRLVQQGAVTLKKSNYASSWRSFLVVGFIEQIMLRVRGILRYLYYKYKKWWFIGLLKKSGEFVFHGPNYHLAPKIEKSVVTLHDLSVLRHPEHHPKDRTDFWTTEIYNVAKRATHIITVSEFQKAEIIELLDVPSERVSVVYLGAEPTFRPYSITECGDVLEKYNLGYKQYSLVVATIEPRKNVIRLMQALQAIPESIRREYPLAIVGDKGWGSDAIHDMISELENKNQVVRLGYVSEDDLPRLYASARVFLYPSIYEGFGLPVLEAMSCGVPVLTSNCTSLPEVAGEACLLVDPYSVDEIAEGWQKLLIDESFQKDLSDAGIQQAKQFSWQRCAEQTIDVYKAL